MVAKGPILSLVVLAIAACLFEPADRVAGQWGGSGISLDARKAEVQLQLPCLKAVSGELNFVGAGHFEATAQITSGFVRWTSFHMSGDVNGDDMMMAVTYMTPSYTATEPEQFALRRSAKPDFSNIGCLK